MKRFLILMALLIGAALPAKATCPSSRILPTGLNLPNPNISDGFDVWADCLRDMVIIVNDSAISTTTLAASTAALQAQIDTLSISTVAIQAELDALETYVFTSTFGHTTQDEGSPLPDYGMINFVGLGVEVTDEGDHLQVAVSGTGDLLRSTATLLGNVSTSSSEWESVGGSTMTLVMAQSNFVDIGLSCNLLCTDFTSCGVAYSFLVDGDFITPHTSATDSGIQFVRTDGMNISSPEPILFKHTTLTKLGIGTHTITMLWASIDGVEVQMSTNIAGCSLKYEEAPEQLNTGGVAIISGVTNLGAQSQISLQSLTCDVLPCQAQGTFGSYDIWVATGTLPGQWMNGRTGIGPFE